MQWVTLDDDAPGGGERPSSPAQGLTQPCVWSLAHVATVGAPPPPAVFAPVHVPLLTKGDSRPGWHGDSARRVLLMSAMRAPPARLA